MCFCREFTQSATYLEVSPVVPSRVQPAVAHRHEGHTRRAMHWS